MDASFDGRQSYVPSVYSNASIRQIRNTGVHLKRYEVEVEYENDLKRNLVRSA